MRTTGAQIISLPFQFAGNRADRSPILKSAMRPRSRHPRSVRKEKAIWQKIWIPALVGGVVALFVGLAGNWIWWEWKEEARIERLESREDAREQREREAQIAKNTKQDVERRIAVFVAAIEARRGQDLPVAEMRDALRRTTDLHREADDLYRDEQYPRATAKWDSAVAILVENCPREEDLCALLSQDVGG